MEGVGFGWTIIGLAENRCKMAWQFMSEIQNGTKAAEAFKAWEKAKFGKEAEQAEKAAA